MGFENQEMRMQFQRMAIQYQKMENELQILKDGCGREKLQQKQNNIIMDEKMGRSRLNPQERQLNPFKQIDGM